MGELRKAANLGRDRAAELIAVEAQPRQRELREAANLGGDRAAEPIAAEVQMGQLRVLEELGRYRAVEALVVEVQRAVRVGAVANRGHVPAKRRWPRGAHEA